MEEEERDVRVEGRLGSRLWWTYQSKEVREECLPLIKVGGEEEECEGV